MEAPALSPREMTVLYLIAWGHTNKEIANRLALSVKTVEAHKANAMRKLNVGSRAEIVRNAVDWGWLTKAAVPQDHAGHHEWLAEITSKAIALNGKK